MGGMLYLVQQSRHRAGPQMPIIILLYNGLLLCSFNVPIKGLTLARQTVTQWHAVWRVNDGRARDSVRGNEARVG